MNIACGERFVTDESLTDRPMPRTTAEANKLPLGHEFDKSMTVKKLRKQVAELEAALKAATAAPAPVEKPKAAPAPAPALTVPPPKKATHKATAADARPAAFFSRESLVADVPPTVEAQPVATPSWVPRLPPAAFGRMR
jgi:hypothetical protein